MNKELVDAEFGKVTARHLALVNDAGKEVATITATGDGAGFWITGPEKSMICIYSIRGQTAIGIYDSTKERAVNICMSDGPNQEPGIQLLPAGADQSKLRNISITQLLKLIEKVEQLDELQHQVNRLAAQTERIG